jgi:hypothetical protein
VSARPADAPVGRGRPDVAEWLVQHPLRHFFAGVAFTLAAVNLALIAYLDLLWLDYDRYVWLINGPAPFAGFGSGPFQLWFHVAFALAVGGSALTGVALLRRLRRTLVVGLVAGAIGLAGGPATLLEPFL